MSHLRTFFIFFILLGLNGCFNETGVTIISEPGVFVYINGNEVGEINASGQLLIEDISPGDYTALLVKPGFKPVEHKFTYVAGQDLIVNSAPFDKVDNTNYSEIEDQAYENQMEKTEYLTFTDERDGHEYKYTKIGDQYWMAENLAYIPHVGPAGENSGIWVYGYTGTSVEEAKKTENYKLFGCLYDWEAAKVYCPKGWHLP
ncbi:MAG: FISUMP domain-containing protein, partial [Bacteroidales bacterium]|nr:FISUMP domain-containing protein [Bacteroidales bacterium]